MMYSYFQDPFEAFQIYESQYATKTVLKDMQSTLQIHDFSYFFIYGIIWYLDTVCCLYPGSSTQSASFALNPVESTMEYYDIFGKEHKCERR